MQSLFKNASLIKRVNVKLFLCSQKTSHVCWGREVGWKLGTWKKISKEDHAVFLSLELAHPPPPTTSSTDGKKHFSDRLRVFTVKEAHKAFPLIPSAPREIFEFEWNLKEQLLWSGEHILKIFGASDQMTVSQYSTPLLCNLCITELFLRPKA